MKNFKLFLTFVAFSSAAVASDAVVAAPVVAAPVVAAPEVAAPVVAPTSTETSAPVVAPTSTETSAPKTGIWNSIKNNTNNGANKVNNGFKKADKVVVDAFDKYVVTKLKPYTDGVYNFVTTRPVTMVTIATIVAGSVYAYNQLSQSADKKSASTKN